MGRLRWRAPWSQPPGHDAISPCRVSRRRSTARGRPPLTPGQRFLIGVAVLALVSAIGTIGFVTIEGIGVLDALYLTTTTMSTVGYGDVVPSTPAGKLFTIALIVGGVGTSLYLLTTLAALILEGQLRDFLGRGSMQRKIEHLEGHVVLIGYGRFGRVVADELVQGGASIAIVDSDPSNEPDLRSRGAPYVIGSGLVDEILEQAGVRRARAIVVATPSDSDNVFITLSAREKNPSIAIHARAEAEAGMRRLKLAGANQVLSAYHSGGQRMAASILRPTVVDFLDLSLPGRGETVALEEVQVGRGSTLAEQPIREIEEKMPRLRIVALKRLDEPIRIVPDAETKVVAGDLLIAIGDRQSLNELAQNAGG